MTYVLYFTYSANGNLSVEHDVDPSAGRTYYDYEPRNLLSRVDFPGALATNYFYYNAPGERIRKDDSTGGKKYTWDGLIPIVEKNLSNTTTQRMVKGYTPVQGIGDYLLQDVNGTIIYPHKNQVGTTVRHTDDSQAVVNTYEYDAWGVPIAVTESTAQQYRFTGKELDGDRIELSSANERYIFRYRSYIANRATFLQVDPLQYVLDNTITSFIHAYSYVRSNPTMYADPFGLQDDKPTVKSLADIIKDAMDNRMDVDPKGFSGCPEDQSNPIWRAVAQAYLKFLGSSMAKAKHSNPEGLRKSLLKCIKNVTIKCHKACDDTHCKDDKDVAGKMQPTCAYWDGDSLILCTDNLSKPACGGANLQKTIIHEIAHCAGLTHGPRPLADKPDTYAQEVEGYYGNAPYPDLSPVIKWIKDSSPGLGKLVEDMYNNLTDKK